MDLAGFILSTLCLFLSLCRHPGASSDHGWNRQELEPCMDPASRPPPQDDGPMRMPTKVLNITTRRQPIEVQAYRGRIQGRMVYNCGGRLQLPIEGGANRVLCGVEVEPGHPFYPQQVHHRPLAVCMVATRSRHLWTTKESTYHQEPSLYVFSICIYNAI